MYDYIIQQCSIKFIMKYANHSIMIENNVILRIKPLTRMNILILDGLIDMILELGIPELPFGINTTIGMCGTSRNTYQIYPSPAYSMNKNTLITIGAQDVFPIEFPTDFSLLIVLRSIADNEMTLFSIYSSDSEKVLSLTIGTDIALYYQDTDGNPFESSKISFDINISDKRSVYIFLVEETQTN